MNEPRGVTQNSNVQVMINEVALRDGLQNQPKLIATKDKLLLANALVKVGISSMEVTSCVHPKAMPQMADAEEIISHFSGRQFSVLVPNQRGYQRAVAAGAKSIALVVASTDLFNKKNINMSLDEVMSVVSDVVKQAKADDVFVRVYLSGACECPYQGKIAVEEIHRLVAQLIAMKPDEVSIADTTGAGNPQQIIQLLQPLVNRYGSDMFNVHLHDTRGLALANAWAALSVGITKFDSSVGGLGGCPFAPGASGNLATEDLVFMLHEAGYETGIDLAELVNVVQLAEDITQSTLGGKMLPWYRQKMGLTNTKQAAH